MVLNQYKKYLFIIFTILLITPLVSSQNNRIYFAGLSNAALNLTETQVIYDPSYYSIPYPNGDIPAGRGVCTDVIIRAYRKLGCDLQKKVHEDMRRNFSRYPQIWGARGPDKNIDHRRVPNLMRFFKRKGAALRITKNPRDYLPGDVVAWRLNSGQTHIGIVVHIKSRDKKRYQIVHNIGFGQVLEDVLFDYTIIGHYRYRPR